MNLENLNLVELNAQEVESTDGGYLLEAFIATGPIGWVNGAIFAIGAYNGYYSH